VSILECHIFQVCVIFEKPNMFSVIFCQLQMTVSIVECHFSQVITFYLITIYLINLPLLLEFLTNPSPTINKGGRNGINILINNDNALSQF
jgi:hypothetical protein